MNIGIIGAGALGSNAARLLVKTGVSATIANSRGPQSLSRLVGELGLSVKAGSVEEAASADSRRIARKGCFVAIRASMSTYANNAPLVRSSARIDPSRFASPPPGKSREKTKHQQLLGRLF